MHRNRKIVLLSHCILNVNSKVEDIASYSGAMEKIVMYLIQQGIGFIQLPCPEMTLYGMKRWGHVKEQFDNPFYRRHCKSIFENFVDQIKEYQKNDYEILGLIGIDGSPSCGVSETCSGNWCGEMMNEADYLEKMKTLKTINSQGVFIEEIHKALQAEYIQIPMIGIDEMDPNNSIEKIKKFIGGEIE